MRGVQKCTCAGASLRGSNFVPLCCIKLDTATDPFIGSGTTAVAALETGRKYIGYEIDERYYTAAMERISLCCDMSHIAAK